MQCVSKFIWQNDENMIRGKCNVGEKELEVRPLQTLALMRCSCLSYCPRFLSQPTEEQDSGEGGRRRGHRVQAQDVSLGCGVLEEGQRTAQRK